MNDEIRALKRKVGNYIKWGGLTLVALIVGMGSWFTTDAGYIYVVQDTLFGSLRTYTQPGVHFKVPLFTNVTEYKQVATIGTVEEGDQGKGFTRNMPLVNVQFADTYTGNVPVTFRFKLPMGEKQILEMHNEFRSFENLVDALLVKNAKNVTVVTATQYTGEEFFQGGINQYKARLEDQLRNGLYETERRQVEIEQTDMAAVSSDNSNANKLEKRTRLVWKNVVLTDVNGQERRLDNPLELYGISVTQVTIGRPKADTTLESMLDNKRRLVAERIAAVQTIETAEAQAKAEQQKVEIEKRKAIQLAQKDKELAIIAKQKEVEQERQQAELEKVRQQKQKDVAVIQKNKELEIAQAERDIQKANSEAAVFQAKAIKETGLAEAEVDRAKLAAKQSASDIYMAEIQRDIANVMYTNLKDFQINMPQNYVSQGGPEGGIKSNLDVLSAFGALGVMDNLRKKVPAER